MTEYRIECHVEVDYDAFIHADSYEEALEIAEKKADEWNKQENNFFHYLDEEKMYIDECYESHAQRLQEVQTNG
jgi:surface antigen